VTIRNPAFMEEAKTWQHLCVVEVKLRDAADLGYLQCAWAMARWLVRGGAAAVFDDAARTWHTAAAVLEWPAPLDFKIDRETQLVFETDTEPGRGHLMHSRGMRKFGRPDVLTELPPGQGLRWQVDELAKVLTAISTELALGQTLAAGRMVQMETSVFDLEDYLPGQNLPDVKLENAGLVLKRRSFPQPVLGAGPTHRGGTR
jgi:hypothetical protein